MVRDVWIGVLTPEKHTDHRTQQMSTWYIYQIPIRVQAYHRYYWKPLRHCRWLDSPRAFNFAKLRVQYCSMLFIASRSILLIPGKTMLNLLNDSELFWTTKILRHAAGLLTYRSFCSAFPALSVDIDSWQLTVSQWLIRIWTSDCESQQRDCAGLSPASLTLNAVQRYNKKCTYARKRTLFYKKIIDFYLFVPFYLTMGACLQ